MTPPKASLKKRSASSPTAASTSREAPTPVPTVARRLGNEQTLALLRAQQAKASDGSSREGSADHPDVDPWSTLSAGGRKRAEGAYRRCFELIGALNDAQTAHVSTLRRTWINHLAHDVLVQIGTVDSDAKIAAAEHALDNYSTKISERIVDFDAEWVEVERRYQDERGWLSRQKFDDATFAAKRLDDLYNESRHWLDGGAEAYITDEDYAALKQTLVKHTHISTGVLQGSRIRAHDVHDLINIVGQLRNDEQDPDKYAPGWRKQVDDELENLGQLAKRTPATAGTDFSAEFIRLRDDLRAQRDAVLQKRPLAERVAVGIAKVPIAGVNVVIGAAEAVVGPFVEAARELIDEAQIGLYYVSGGRYLPKLTSDLMKAFEQGATRTDVLKGLVSGIVGTPKRFLQAVEDGDWEAVGKEAVNLYLLMKVVKESPQYISRVPEFLVTARRALRVLKARTLSLRLKSPRLAPEPLPVRYGPGTPPDPLPAAPTFLFDPALRDLFLRLVRTGGRGAIDIDGVALHGIQAVMVEGGTLRVSYASIENVGRVPTRGRLTQLMFEQAAIAAARATGATGLQVMVEQVINWKLIEYLKSLGYTSEQIPHEFGFSKVWMRTVPL